jgi:Mn2+/Fe2+ NRAMP family transporter
MAENQVERDRQLILGARKKGSLATLLAYVRLSGPGWLQSAITLGGGSLASSLYLGILAGFSLLWLQPLAMILGVVMLSAIGYVALSTGERPFHAINRHVNPVLGWGWAIATLMANLVWAMPQFTLGTSSIRENLLPGLFGSMPVGQANLILGVAILVICAVVVWFYDTGSKGIKAFEIILKVMVAVIIVCFFGVVVRMSTAGALDWRGIGRGIIPDVRLLYSPADTFTPYLQAVGEEFRGFWEKMIVSQQRDVMISAAATAVGINMTFLLPYSMLKRGWNRDFRGLAVFDLSTGLFVPFILATGCVVIASASQFHAVPAPGLLGEKDAKGALVVPDKKTQGKFDKIAAARAQKEIGAEAWGDLSAEQQAATAAALPQADRRMAAMLVRRDAFDLAQSLSPLTGKTFAHYVFGVGVVGMAISSIIILMLINGFVICEMLGRPSHGWLYRFGCLAPGITGFCAPFLWSGRTQFWLAVPTSVFGFMLIPIAYVTFALVMNSRNLLGEHMPRGGKRWVWNVLMILAAGLVAMGSFWNVWNKAKGALGSGWYGLGAIGAFIALAVIVHVIRKVKASSRPL